jgi:hypothetical protein
MRPALVACALAFSTLAGAQPAPKLPAPKRPALRALPPVVTAQPLPRALSSAQKLGARSAVAKALNLDTQALAEPRQAMSLAARGDSITLGPERMRVGEAYASINRAEGATYHNALWRGPGPDGWGSLGFVLPAITSAEPMVFDLDCPVMWTLPSPPLLPVQLRAMPADAAGNEVWSTQDIAVTVTGGAAGRLYTAVALPAGTYRFVILSVGIHDLPQGHSVSMSDCTIGRLR